MFQLFCKYVYSSCDATAPLGVTSVSRQPMMLQRSPQTKRVDEIDSTFNIWMERYGSIVHANSEAKG